MHTPSHYYNTNMMVFFLCWLIVLELVLVLDQSGCVLKKPDDVENRFD
jgi:hypothetical protein